MSLILSVVEGFSNIFTENVSVLSGALFILAILESVFLFKKEPNFPPGPRGLPFLGSLPFLAKDSHAVLMNWAQIYGDVFSVQFGNCTVVILNGYDAIKEAFIKKGRHFAGRPKLYSFQALLKGKGILSSDYTPGYTARRRFTLHTLRDLGMGKSRLEGKIHEELYHLMKAVENQNGEAFEIDGMITRAVANIIFSMLFGKRFDYENELFAKVLKTINRNAELASNAAAQNFIPLLRTKLFPQTREQWGNRELLSSTMMKWIQEQKETYQPNVTRGYVDALRHEMTRREGDPDFSEDQLVVLVMDLFFAGSETIATTLKWSVLYALAFPDIQHKVQSELDSWYGTDDNNKPTVTDRSSLPYTEATLSEIQRRQTVLPLGAPHCTTEDTKLRGYTLPKGTMVVGNLWSAMMDPERWVNPEQFSPERFLGKDGRVVKHESYIPFGTGKRICVGEQLARMEVFLFFTTLLKNFSFAVPEGYTLPELKGRPGITLGPPKYKLCATKRTTG